MGISAVGRPTRVEGMNFYRLDDGRVTDIWVQFDTPRTDAATRRHARLTAGAGNRRSPHTAPTAFPLRKHPGLVCPRRGSSVAKDAVSRETPSARGGGVAVDSLVEFGDGGDEVGAGGRVFCPAVQPSPTR